MKNSSKTTSDNSAFDSFEAASDEELEAQMKDLDSLLDDDADLKIDAEITKEPEDSSSDEAALAEIAKQVREEADIEEEVITVAPEPQPEPEIEAAVAEEVVETAEAAEAAEITPAPQEETEEITEKLAQAASVQAQEAIAADKSLVKLEKDVDDKLLEYSAMALKQLMKKWLDENMEKIVEKIVKEEMTDKLK